jgi:hypothetical protein
MITSRDVIATCSKLYHVSALEATPPTLALGQLKELFVFVRAVTLVRCLLAPHTCSGGAMTARTDIGGH